MKKQGNSGLTLYLWMLSYLGAYWRRTALYLFLTLFATGIALAVPKCIQYFIDYILPARDFGALSYVVGGLVVAVAAMIASQAAVNVLQRQLSENVLQDIRMDLLSQLRKLGFSYVEKHPVGELLHMFTNEVRVLSDLYQRLLPSSIRLLCMVVVALVMVLWISPLMTLIFVPSLALYFLFGAYFAKRAALYGKESREKNSGLQAAIYDMLSGLAELRANGRIDWSLQRIVGKFREFMKVSTLEMIWLQYRGTTRKSIVSYGLFVVFVVGIVLVQSNRLTVGEFVAFVFYYEMVIGRVTTFITVITQQRVALYQVEKVFEKLQLQPDVAEPEVPTMETGGEGGLLFRDVSFGYGGQAPILKDVTLEIRPGERVAIVGETGGGKSTLVKLIGRFYDPVRGEILLDGVPLKRLTFEQLRSRIGYVFQDTYLFGTTIRENLMFGDPDASEEDMLAAAKAAYVHEFAERLPEGYDTRIGERGITLSGGQKQRLSIARMLLKKPSIVVLDEATASLDNMSESEVLHAFDTLLHGRTTIAIAHRLSTIRHYDRIVVLDKGEIKEQGTYAQLMERKGIYYSLERRGERENGELEMAN